MRYCVLLGPRSDFLFLVITILLQTLVVRLDCGWHVPTPHITGFQPAVANVQGGPWALPDRGSSLVSNLTEIQISWHPWVFSLPSRSGISTSKLRAGLTLAIEREQTFDILPSAGSECHTYKKAFPFEAHRIQGYI